MAGTVQTRATSTSLDHTRRRVERWRETRRHRHAAQCPPRCGMRPSRRHVSTGSTAPRGTLRVDYGALKKHLEARAGEASELAAPTFVELAPSGLASPACVIEIDGPRGTLRIRLGGLALRDLVAVAQLWGEAS